jgi:uncharacterized protein (TIGR01777 family)
MHVFVAGGTGLIGTRLVRRLHQRRDTITVLTRRPEAAQTLLGPDCRILGGDPTQPGPWMEAVDDCDAVVNLAGENLFSQRWSSAFKQVIRDSRLKSTANVVRALARKPLRAAGDPKVLVNASAVGYYGPRGDEELTEDSPAGDDFLAKVCVEWEQAARGAETLGVRVAIVRSGVVLARDGGALKQLLPTFQMGMGGPTGSGRQWLSWVDPLDLAGSLLLALDNAAVQGAVNGTAPNPVTNRDFAQVLGRALHRPAVMPTPAFALRLMLGEAAEIALTGQRVLPAKLMGLGYAFQFPSLDQALAHALAESPAP